MKSSLSVADSVMSLAKIMDGLKLGVAIALAPAMIFGGLAVSSVTPSMASSLDGAAVSKLIVARLADEGLEGMPAIAADRDFPACDSTPEIAPMFGGWNTVAVTCSSNANWRFAIRTNLSSRPAPVPVRNFRPGQAARGPIERAVTALTRQPDVIDEIEVVALARSVSRNDMIGAGDLTMVAVPARNSVGAFFDPADVAGRRAKSSLSAMKPVMARHLYPDYLVEEGNEVLISSSAGGIRVDMVGYALENGQIGEWIGVENASSGKTIRAKITGEKKVTVVAKK